MFAPQHASVTGLAVAAAAAQQVGFVAVDALALHRRCSFSGLPAGRGVWFFSFRPAQGLCLLASAPKHVEE